MRTIANGIPGTAMTPFVDSLPESDRRAVARYVLTMVPEEKHATSQFGEPLGQKIPLFASRNSIREISGQSSVVTPLGKANLTEIDSKLSDEDSPIVTLTLICLLWAILRV